MNLENLGVQEMNGDDMKSVDGGFPIGPVLVFAAAIGAGCAWCFQKGEELGKAMA